MNPVADNTLLDLSPDAKRELLAQLLAKKQAKQDPQRFPLSHAQRRLWFLEQLQPGQAGYHIPAALKIGGDLSVSRLDACLRAIIARHEALRSRFLDTDGEPYVVIAAESELDLAQIRSPDFGQPAAQQADFIRRQCLAFGTQAFDLAAGPLLRTRLLATGEQEWVLLLCLHHIVADYWSLRLLLREMAVLYDRETDASAALPALPIQYPDYAAWQIAETARTELHLDYWRGRLRNLPPPLALPYDKPRPALQSGRGRRLGFRLDPALSADLRQLARGRQCSLFALLLAAFDTLLFRFSGDRDICVGATISNRGRPELQNLIGLFVNNLVLRADIEPDMAFTELLEQVKLVTLEAFEHQDVPFEQVVDALNIERRLDRHPLFQVMFILHNTPEQRIEIPGLRLEALEWEGFSTRFDLALDMTDSEQGLYGHFEFSTDLFETDTVAGFSGYFQALLQAIAVAPETPVSALDLWPDAATAASAPVCGPRRPIASGGVPALLDSALARHADRIALQCGELSLSYREFHQQAGRLADWLRIQGAAAGSRIALCLPRTADLALAMVACLRLGAAYVPLDPRQPTDRLALLLQRAAADWLLAASESAALAERGGCPLLALDSHRAAIAARPGLAATESPPPETTAYLIFTSGTTGVPKGVTISQRALANLLTAMRDRPGMRPGDALLAITTVAFDIAGLELLLPLCAGAKLVIADEDTAGDAGLLATALSRYRISHLQATPATWRLLAESGWSGDRRLKMLCGGEALPPDLARRLLALGGELWNLYGPTETTIWSAALRVEAGLAESASSSLPIGGVIANTWFSVVDRHLKPVPPGVTGELLIGGDGLSAGYFQQAALSAEKFIDIALPDGSAAKAYRSGDRVRRRRDGLFEFLGRADHQIKLRGFRIEPGEIETALTGHPAVAQALAGLAPAGEDAQLAVWYRLAVPDTESPGAAELRDYLRDRLPAYMLPTAWMPVAAFPLNANGKIDRKALPVPDGSAAVAASGRQRPPSRDAEIRLAELWSELLPQPVRSADDDFFALGGHSLLAARLIAGVRKRFGVELPLRQVFERPSLSAFAQLLAEPAGPNNRLPDIGKADRNQPLPLSHAQQRQWVLAQLEPDNPFYTIPAAVAVNAELDREILSESVRRLAERHETLRAAFVDEAGLPRPIIAPTIEPPIRFHDLRAEAEAAGQARAENLLSAAARRCFDLAQAPLFEVTVVELGPKRSVILLNLHHILADAWSLRILVRDLAALYTAQANDEAPRLPPLTLQYADYAAWQRQADFGADLAYWQAALNGAPTLLDLPTDFPRPPLQGYAGGQVPIMLDRRCRDAVAALALARGATPFMVLLAVFGWLLARYSRQTDIVVGAPIGHRPHSDLENVVGLFANTLALRIDAAGCASFTELLGRVRVTVLNGFAHQQAPFDQVLDSLRLERSWAHSPLFQAFLLWQPLAAPSTDSLTGAADWLPWPLPADTTKFDLTLNLVEQENGIAGRLEFRSDLFRRETAEFIADTFATLLESLLAAPDGPLSLAALPGKRQQALLAQWQQASSGISEPFCLDAAFAASAAANAQATALIWRDLELSYAEVDRHAEALARCLTGLGVGPEIRVGICLPRTPDLVIALLATLKAGGAYVPMDPAYPAARRAAIFANAKPRVLLTAAAEAGAELQQLIATLGTAVVRLDQPLPAAADRPPAAKVQPENTAYIIYTSGSTGIPKGVTIEHRQVAALLTWARGCFAPAQLAGVLAGTSICFDLSVFELFVPLTNGGCVILADNVLALPELPARDRVTLINTVPSAAVELLRLGPLPAAAATVNLAGEPVPEALVRDLYAQPGVGKVYNLYGPSEDTTYSTAALLERPAQDRPALPVSIGAAIDNTRCYLLDEHFQQVAIGMIGELYLAGAGVSRGYWDHPALTAERYLPNPFAAPETAGRDYPLLYRTGDLARWRPDGQLEFFGRADRQIKLRGFRIELGDIETALLGHPAVQQAAVGVWRDATGNPRLSAYLVGQTDVGGLAEALRRHLQDCLPDYMVPAFYTVLAELPRLPNGKIDRQRLPAPAMAAAPAAEETEPADDLEARLNGIWQRVLNLNAVGRDANFFALGGDSILAIQAVAALRQAGYAISPRDLFQHPSVAALAGFLRAQAPQQQTPRAAVTGPVPLTPIQHWFFDHGFAQQQHWNQSLLLACNGALEETALRTTADFLLAQHDALRAGFRNHNGLWRQTYAERIADNPVHVVREVCGDVAACLRRHGEAAQAGFDLAKPPLWRLVYFELQTGQGPVYRLLLVFHHLLVDAVSWRILLQDLQRCYADTAAGRAPQAPPRSASCLEWVEHLQARHPEFEAQRPFWQAQVDADCQPLPCDRPGGSNNRMQHAETLSVQLPETDTLALFQSLPANLKLRGDELVLAALLATLSAWNGSPRQRIALESHGRDDGDGGIDLSRSVGWLTALYPLTFRIAADADSAQLIRQVREQLQAVPTLGIGYGVLRWLDAQSDAGADSRPSLYCRPEIRFNYLGRADGLLDNAGFFSLAAEPAGPARAAAAEREVLIDINAMVKHGALHLHWSYSRELHEADTIRGLAERHLYTLKQLIEHCRQHAGGLLTPADFPEMGLNAADLDDLLDHL